MGAGGHGFFEGLFLTGRGFFRQYNFS